MRRNRILDAHDIRASCRDLIRRIKKAKNPNEKLVLLAFIKEIDREISSFLISSGYKLKDVRHKQ